MIFKKSKWNKVQNWIFNNFLFRRKLIKEESVKLKKDYLYMYFKYKLIPQVWQTKNAHA